MFRALVLWVCLATPLAADEERARHLAAALDLARQGFATQSAAPLVLASEMLADLAPGGITVPALARSWQEEARFLARGDQAILDRLDALAPRTPVHVLHIAELAPRLVLPEGRRLRALVLPRNLRLTGVAAKDGAVCTPGALPDIWHCDPAARGPLDLVPQPGAGPGPLILILDPP
ncbi:MAG: hypothetical protein OIF48_05415 [Silicimonas sp.]|nr:hypothetical protein [Silicimonas sp.]